MAEAQDLERERQALQLVEESLHLSAEERRTFLAVHGEKQPEVSRRAMELLALHAERTLPPLTGAALHLLEPALPAPETIGPYRVIRKIGSGGMGTVFEAVRSFSDFEHRVAIKLVSHPSLSADLLARFRQERRLLAGLNHPHIARFYGGGETADGQPYIVMEYVEGLPLDEWAAQAGASLAERLTIFAQICDAVKLAHQQLVIHRDLTPRNVLVTPAGEARLIDFGISRLASGGADGQDGQLTPPPGWAGQSATPGYDAPERRTDPGSSTLVDIYALGRILQFLLPDGAPDELAAIAARACHDDPQQRYPSVDALVADLNRFENDLPLATYSTAPGYRLRKFIRRQRALVLAGGALAASLIGGLGAFAWSYGQAEAARTEAEQRFADLRELTTFQIFDLHDQLARVPGNTGIRAQLLTQAQRYLESLSDHQRAPVDLQLDSVRGNIRLANIMGVPAQPTLGDVPAARAALERARATLENLAAMPGRSTPDLAATLASLGVSAAAAEAMILVHAESDLQRAAQLVEETASQLAGVPAPQRKDEWHLARRSLLYAELALADQGSDPAQLRRLAARLGTEPDEWPDNLRQSLIARQDRAYPGYWLGVADYIESNFRSAVGHHHTAQAALTQLEEEYRRDPMLLYLIGWNAYLGYGSASMLEDVAVTQTFLDLAADSTGRLVPLAEEDSSIRRLELQIREARSQFVAARGDLAEAIRQQHLVLADQRVLAGDMTEGGSSSAVAFSHIILAFMYRDAAQLPDACAHLVAARDLLQPSADQGRLVSYMMNAANRLPAVIAACQNGADLGRQNALFE